MRLPYRSMPFDQTMNFMSNFRRQRNFNAGWRGGNQWNNQGGAQYGTQGKQISASTQPPVLGFGHNFVEQEDRKPA